ncbi:transcriptional regulator GutM [Anaerococcus sp. AGMB00486]|uniref:Transcriptional regulator GutM n=2 Tax=Anaerococcus TaxID=165779 RepID=A0ABX2NBM2_9FIRM|nr:MULTISPECIES: transcriptional regulator GutM [Anaerococcus]MDY3006651.1 transcriptional regulator GutM [Anaerococcus porci]MSS78118.1 hypothetical protein [Anaerococcus porci]NVF12078.1 transcriptional regulator GutM [Anaerococcus faecalis]
MSNFVYLGIFILSMYLLQYFFTFLQMNSFRDYFNKYIKDGKVAIGIKKGAIRAGAIVMFSVDELGNIKKYAYIHGVSVFARFKEKDLFRNANIKDLDEEILNELKIEKNIRLAILNARNNFIKAENGEEIKMEKSPLQKAFGFFRNRK